MTHSNVASYNAMGVGENRRVRYSCTASDGTAVSSWAGYTIGWYLLNDDVNGPLAAVQAAAVVAKSSANAGEIDLTAPPYATVTLVAGDTATLVSGTYRHQLWRIDSGNERQLSYGDFPLR